MQKAFRENVKDYLFLHTLIPGMKAIPPVRPQNNQDSKRVCEKP
jgi:hypothetical protein